VSILINYIVRTLMVGSRRGADTPALTGTLFDLETNEPIPSPHRQDDRSRFVVCSRPVIFVRGGRPLPEFTPSECRRRRGHTVL